MNLYNASRPLDNLISKVEANMLNDDEEASDTKGIPKKLRTATSFKKQKTLTARDNQA